MGCRFESRPLAIIRHSRNCRETERTFRLNLNRFMLASSFEVPKKAVVKILEFVTW